MRFKNERQKRAVCHLLVRLAGRGDLWAPTGPTHTAQGHHSRDLDAGERVLFLASWAFWEGDDTLSFSELKELAPEELFALGSLLAACAVDAMQPEGVRLVHVDEWLAGERRLIAE